jgi:membrane protease YdiL (CAAX protease family)
VASLLREKWVWIIIAMLIAIVVLPMVVVLFILELPAPLRLASLIGLVFCWALASAYKEWTKDKREEEEKTRMPQ